MRERQELFLDIYGNILIREKSASYLNSVLKELIQVITEDSKCTSVLIDILNFSNLRFKDRDDIEDIFSSYY